MASGGGPPPPKSLGRGGRGLLILEALKKEQAAPGRAPEGASAGRGGVFSAGRAAVVPQPQQPPQQPPLQQPHPLQPPPPLQQPPLAQPNVQPPVSRPAVAGAARPALGGRGNLAGLQAMMQQQQQSGFRGRGGILAAAAVQKVSGDEGAAARPPMVQVPAASASMQAGEPAVPVGTMARMTVSEPEPAQEPSREERSRQPTVTRRGVPGKQGGQPSSLAVNYIKLRARNKNIFQYHVSFSPVIDSKGMRVGLLNEHKDKMPVKLFDGTILFLPEKLPQDETQLVSTRKTDGSQIFITIKFIKNMPTEQCPHLYNILLRRIMSLLNLCQVGRYYYNPATPSQVPQHKLEVWPGYITSIKEHEGGLMLLLDSSHRVLRCQTVLELMSEIINERPQSFQEEVTRRIVGCTVLTRYNNKTYRIDDIDWGKTPQSSFTTSTDKEITFAEYYWNQYGKKVDQSQPLLVHRPKPQKINGRTVQPRTELICLIPELCHLTGLTDDLRQNFRVMKDLGNHTRCTPSQRLVTMKKFVDSINGNAEARQQLQNWGLSLDDTALAVEGRKMNMENIFFGDGRSASAGPKADWGRDLSHNKVITAVDLENWIIFFSKKNGPDVLSFIQEAQRAAPRLGIRVTQPAQVPLQDDRTETLVRALRQSVNPRTQLVCVVMPTSREDKYAAVKKFACVDCPVPSQVIIHKTIRDKKKLNSVTQKIVLQINCKLGGELWAVKNPLETAMVVGIDAFHDVSRGRKSIGGFVASTNPELTRWFSRVRIQMQGEELAPGLRIFMVSAIRKYYECNHRKPEKIIVYRDGVGDGQLPVVQDFEVRQMMDSFADFSSDYHPKLTVVIVQKRINTRIFQHAERGPRGSSQMLENPPPGTVLDHTVTRRDQYDYFVVSQHVNQGTVSPTHYIVVHDDVNLPPERMQVFTYKMTHLYYNWPGTVRVPAPCLYAHKLAYLVGESIHQAPSDLLSDRLFFL